MAEKIQQLLVAFAEILEQLEQLRALYHGERIHVDSACQAVPAGVDTPEDLDAVRRRVAAAEDAPLN